MLPTFPRLTRIAGSGEIRHKNRYVTTLDAGGIGRESGRTRFASCRARQHEQQHGEQMARGAAEREGVPHHLMVAHLLP